MRVAKEGWPFIAIAWLILAVLLWFRWWIGLAWLPVAVWVVAFFRDPLREGPRGEELVLAPADGLVVGVIPTDEPAFLRGPASRISIFMSVFDVHVNRYPAGGRVALTSYLPGEFGHAMAEKASERNEQSTVGLETPRGRILIRQIAGAIARRIVTDHGEGALVSQCQRMGLIRFGSRVDVFLPPGAQILVRAGERTRTARTVIARWT